MGEHSKKVKTIAFRSDEEISNRFDAFLKEVREISGEKILKEEAFQFLMEHARLDLKPKGFIARLYAYKAKKFSKS